MKNFQHWWIKFCCFLTGYNFYILSNCSEVSIRKVKKYGAALLIITTIWAFVGFCFCNQYIKLDITGSIVGSIIAVFIVIQIERQILLADKNNFPLAISRIILAVLMSIIGSLVMDQIIFKDDIEKSKMQENQRQVSVLLPEKTRELISQINKIDSMIALKEKEHKALINDINKNPVIQFVETNSSHVPVSKLTRDSSKTYTVLQKSTNKTTHTIQNPKIQQLPTLENQITFFHNQKKEKEDKLLNIKSLLEKEVKEKKGFLDELNVMFDILKESTVAMFVYFIWLVFFLFLELLILISKLSDKESDYDMVIQKQMAIHLRKVELL